MVQASSERLTRLVLPQYADRTSNDVRHRGVATARKPLELRVSRAIDSDRRGIGHSAV